MKSARVDGAQLRAIREAQARTLTELAADVELHYPRGVDISMLSMIENGKRQPSAKLFVALCKALETSREDLLTAAVA